MSAYANQTIRDICVALTGKRIPPHPEAAAQQEIAQLLQQAGMDPRPEVRLGARDRVDFLCHGIAVEVKVGRNWQARAVLRQCQRYLLHEEVLGLVVVSGKPLVLPPVHGGKPVRVFSIGKGWL